MGNKFEGKVAIVTGSSSGIGKATALRMAGDGATVCVVANSNTEGGEATAQELQDAGHRSLFVQADVSVASDCERIVEATLGAFGQVDVLINNAGITRTRPLLELDEELWDRTLNTNLKSAYMMSRLVVPDMLQRGQGAVVNIASVHAESTVPGGSAYAASKAGLCGLTRGLAVEFGTRGIRFNCILPGTIDISIHSRRNIDVDRATWAPRRNNAQVMGRDGAPDEVAAAICFLASDEASFINGESLTVDGGLLTLLRDH